jgi:nicotinate-nucleotide--dimethylbenzimidazole phosphoribosyltransferase
MNNFEKKLKSIKPISTEYKTQIQNHLNSLTKPIGSLGKLENFAMKFALIKNTPHPELKKKRIILFAADHGVTKEGVSAYPKEVTKQMVYNILNGGAAINVFAGHIDADLNVVDIGIDGMVEHSNLFNRKIKNGTSNATEKPAMTLHEAVKAIETGIEFAERAKSDKIDIIATGEMGIGNTTAASALFAALLPCNVKDITGKGTGIDEKKLKKKAEVIKKMLNKNNEKLTNPVNTLAAVGGLEIAGIVGLIIGAAANRIPVVIDGFISSAAALTAYKINPIIEQYTFHSHLSAEKGHKLFYKALNTEPALDLKMRLGEGTGAALTIGLIEASIKIYNEMATFESAGVSNND